MVKQNESCAHVHNQGIQYDRKAFHLIGVIYCMGFGKHCKHDSMYRQAPSPDVFYYYVVRILAAAADVLVYEVRAFV